MIEVEQSSLYASFIFQGGIGTQGRILTSEDINTDQTLALQLQNQQRSEISEIILFSFFWGGGSTAVSPSLSQNNRVFTEEIKIEWGKPFYPQ